MCHTLNMLGELSLFQTTHFAPSAIKVSGGRARFCRAGHLVAVSNLLLVQGALEVSSQEIVVSNGEVASVTPGSVSTFTDDEPSRGVASRGVAIGRQRYFLFGSSGGLLQKCRVSTLLLLVRGPLIGRTHCLHDPLNLARLHCPPPQCHTDTAGWPGGHTSCRRRRCIWPPTIPIPVERTSKRPLSSQGRGGRPPGWVVAVVTIKEGLWLVGVWS